uniref:AIG1-type G domain-containing protein n=1 Tax=Amphimedon queenslandica TaxID=400682 RepID=A0A1X7SEN6_AMPQE
SLTPSASATNQTIETDLEVGLSMIGCEDTPASDVANGSSDKNMQIPVSCSFDQDSIDISNQKVGFTAMATTKELLKDEKASTDITLLIIGRTGQGKSALANSIFEMSEEIAKEGADADSCTAISQSYHYPNAVPGISIIVIDTPGLQDTQGKEDAYIRHLKQKHNEVSLVLYCMKMTDHRLCNDDKVAITKLDEAFGREFWERVVFVLTF